MKKLAIWMAIGMVFLMTVSWLLDQQSPRIEKESYLVVNLSDRYVEEREASFLSRVLGRNPTPMAELLSRLATAELDDRIIGAIFRISSLEIGWAKAQEIRDAIARLDKKGVSTLAYLEVEKFGGNLEYYVASAASRIYVAPGSRNSILGLAAESYFLGGFFERIGIQIEYERIGDYKISAETFAEKEISQAGREMTSWILDSIATQFIEGIADKRSISPEEVRSAIDAAPSTPNELQDRKLIDGIKFFDEVVADLGEPPLVQMDLYSRVDPLRVGFRPEARVALVYGSGPIVTSDSSRHVKGGRYFDARDVSDALRDASMDDEIDAIILRIDSPGGSALASDIVWRATQIVKTNGKVLVASLSDSATSGGYYAACGADRIVAEPGTISGSIGVFVLRPAIGELLRKLNIGVDIETRGRHADLLLSSQPLSDLTRKRLRSDIEGVYQTFIDRVSSGRGLSRELVDSIGRGRVFTGVQALEHGLVDTLGGLRTAVVEAKRLAGFDLESDAVLIPYPNNKPLVVQLRETFSGLLWSGFSNPGFELIWNIVGGFPSGTPILFPPYVTTIH